MANVIAINCDLSPSSATKIATELSAILPNKAWFLSAGRRQKPDGGTFVQRTKAMDGLATGPANARTYFISRLDTLSKNTPNLKRKGSMEFVFPFRQIAISAYRKMNSAAASG